MLYRDYSGRTVRLNLPLVVSKIPISSGSLSNHCLADDFMCKVVYQGRGVLGDDLPLQAKI